MVCLVIYQPAIRPHVPDFSHGVDLLNKYLKEVLEPHSLMLKRGAIEGFQVHLLLFYAEMAFISMKRATMLFIVAIGEPYYSP